MPHLARGVVCQCELSRKVPSFTRSKRMPRSTREVDCHRETRRKMFYVWQKEKNATFGETKYGVVKRYEAA